MYRYGDGSPFPLDENFIDTLTAAVEACTNAFMPLTALDGRRDRARLGRADAERELKRLKVLETALSGVVGPFLGENRGSGHAETVANKVAQVARAALQQSRAVIGSRVGALEAEAAAATAADAVLHALRPFFDHHQLPASKWIYAWDVRGAEPRADAVAVSGRITASYQCTLHSHRAPIRVGDLADRIVVHMMKKGLLGKARPAPFDLGKYAMVAFEQTGGEHIVTLKERADRPAAGLRFSVSVSSATWQSIGLDDDAEGDPSPLDFEDFDSVRRLGEAAAKALGAIPLQRTLVDLAVNGQSLDKLPEPRVAPMEVLQQLTALSRSIRARSRVPGELVLKRDVEDGRREELFVPRAQLAKQFMELPYEYRKPFEDMGLSLEDTQPAAAPLRPPAKREDTNAEPTVILDLDARDDAPVRPSAGSRKSPRS